MLDAIEDSSNAKALPAGLFQTDNRGLAEGPAGGTETEFGRKSKDELELGSGLEG